MVWKSASALPMSKEMSLVIDGVMHYERAAALFAMHATPLLGHCGGDGSLCTAYEHAHAYYLFFEKQRQE